MSTTEPTIAAWRSDEPVESERLPAGTEFGSYRIASVLGAGAMGTVYRAEHGVLCKPVALKLMAPALLADAGARQRFLLEAKTTAAIKHRHVVEIVDFGECGGKPYIVMELLDGEDLDRYLETRTRLSSEEAASLLLPIVSALASAHDVGVVHCDLKPSNIFLHHEPEGTLVPILLDFGISRQTLAASSVDYGRASWNHLLGSPHYLSPEAVNGIRDVTTRSDQYSFGVMLYECVTGRAPIERDTLFELLTAIAHGEFAPPSQGVPEVAGPMEKVILRCMQQDPSKRFADMRELGRALLELADSPARLLWRQAFHPENGAQMTSEPPRRVSSDAPTQRPRRRAAAPARRPLLSLAAASACVLAVAGTALLGVAPRASHVDRPLHAAAAPSPASAPPMVASEPPATPEPVVRVDVDGTDVSGAAANGAAVSGAAVNGAAVNGAAVSGAAVSGSGDVEPDEGGANVHETAPKAADESLAERPSPPTARAPRRNRSPQRPSRTAMAARVRPATSLSGAAAGDPLLPPGAAPEPGGRAPRPPGPPTSRASREPGVFGANESPIFD